MADETFSFEIKADAQQADAAASRVQRDLDAVMAKAGLTGRALQDAGGRFLAGSQVSKTAASALAGSIDVAKRSATDLTEALARQAAMFETVRGPEREYMADLKALDALLQKNKISTNQYAEQVQRLNERMGERPEQMGEQYGPVQQQPGPGGSGMLGGLVAGATIVGGIALFQQLASSVNNAVRAFEDASDHLTTLENRARKFQAAGQDLNAVINDQTLLAAKLHAPIEQAMNLYDRVREASDEYGLSQHELYQITTNLGEATQLANRSLDQAGDVIAKLHTAMESGANPARALRTVFTEYPGVLTSMEEAFHTNEAGLFRLASAHKITFEQMLVAIGKYGSGVHEQWQNQQRTYDDMRKSVDDYSQRFEADGDNQVDAIMKGIDKYHEMKDQADALANSMHPLSEAFKSVGDSVKHNIIEPMSANGVLQTWVGVTSTIAIANGYLIGYTNQYTGAIREAKKQMEALKIAHKDLLVVGMEYRQEWERLETIIEHGKLDAHYRLLMEIQDPLTEYRDMIKALNDLYATGQIGLYAYNAQLERLTANAPKGSSFMETGAHHGARGAGAGVLDQGASFVDGGLLGGGLKLEQPHVDEAAEKAADAARARAKAIYDETRSAAEKYSDELATLKHELTDGALNQETYDRAVANLRDKFDDAKTPATLFSEAVDRINEKQRLGVYTMDEYKAKLDALRMTYDKSAGAGIESALRDYRSQMTDANVANQMFKQGVDGIAQAFADMALKGKADIGALLDAMAQAAIKALLFKAILSATGLGQTPGAVDQSAVDALPGHATGTSFMVGGGGGPADSHVVAFRASSGERVTVEPQGRNVANDREAARKGGQHSGGGHVINVFDKRALLPALSSSEGRKTLVNVLSDLGYHPNR